MNNTILYSISRLGLGSATPSTASSSAKKKKARKSRRRRIMAASSSSGGCRSTSLVQGRVKKLQRMIPGGRSLPADQLFSRTADYILHLRLQVHVLQALSKIYNSSTN